MSSRSSYVSSAPTRAIEPGEAGAVRMWMAGRVPVPLLPGDRYVLRELGRGETVGGGEVLDVDPVLPLSRAHPTIEADRVVAERGWIDADQLTRLTGARVAPTVGRWVMAPAALGALRTEMAEMVSAAGSTGIGLASLTEVQRAVLGAGIAGVAVTGERVMVSDAVSDQLGAAAGRVLAVLEAAGCSPPELPLSERNALRELERRGLACQAGDLWFATSAVDAAVEVLHRLLDTNPSGFTVSAARQALATTRKYVLPLLAHLDATGVTRRRGDVRLAGPRLASRIGG